MLGVERSRFKRQPVHPDFLCNLCGEVLWLPLQSKSCRHVFCSECITKHLSQEHPNSNPTDVEIRGSGFCPIDHSRLSHKELSEPPVDLIQSLALLEVECDYSSHGCQTWIQLQGLKKHVDHCLYNPERPIRSKIETILKAQKSLSSSYVKKLLNLLNEKEKIVTEQEELINKILEDGSEFDQIVQQFTQDKVRFEREKSGEVEMLERIICKLQDENDGLRERLYETRQKIIQSNLIDIGQVNGQQWFVYSDASTSNSCESLSMSSRKVLSTTLKPDKDAPSRSNSSRASSASTVKPVSPSHRTLMKKVREQLPEENLQCE